MLNGRILGRMALQLHKGYVQLQRGIREQTDKVCLGGDLQRHEVEDNDTQGTNILHVSTRVVHHEDVFVLQ